MDLVSFNCPIVSVGVEKNRGVDWASNKQRSAGNLKADEEQRSTNQCLLLELRGTNVGLELLKLARIGGTTPR